LLLICPVLSKSTNAQNSANLAIHSLYSLHLLTQCSNYIKKDDKNLGNIFLGLVSTLHTILTCYASDPNEEYEKLAREHFYTITGMLFLLLFVFVFVFDKERTNK